jgi:hypothetical protein
MTMDADISRSTPPTGNTDALRRSPAGGGDQVATLMERVCHQHPGRIRSILASLEACLAELADSPMTTPLEDADAAVAAVKVEIPKPRLWSRRGRAAEAIRESERNASAFEACMAQVLDASLTFARQTVFFREETKTPFLEANLEVREMMRWHRRAEGLIGPGSDFAPAGSPGALKLLAARAKLDTVRRLAENVDSLLRICVDVLATREVFSERIRRNLAQAAERFSEEYDVLLANLRHTGFGVTPASETARSELRRCLSEALAEDWALRENARRAMGYAGAALRLCAQLDTAE